MTQAIPSDEKFEATMRIARQVMEKDWVALRALALHDQLPEFDMAAVIAMAKEQYLAREDRAKLRD